MTNNMEYTEQSQGYDYDAGSDIFGSDGQRIGTLSEKGVRNGYLVVHHGALMGKDAYVPLSKVVDTRQDGIYLDLAKDQLGDFNAVEAPSQAPEYVGSTAGEDTWTFQGAESPAASREPINQPAPLNMRAPRQLGSNLSANKGTNAQPQRETQRVNTEYNDRTNATGATQGDQEIRVPLAEEELVAGKRQTESGRIGLHKDIVEEQKTVNVPVTHDEIQIEHRPVAGGAMPAEQVGEDIFQEKHIDVPVRAEEVVTGKRAQVKDEVRLSRTPVTENQQVTDTVRRERLRVEGDGVNATSSGQHVADNLAEDQQSNTTQP